MEFEDHFTIASDLALVPTLAERIRDIFHRLGLEADVALQLEICLVEAVNNAIQHGYAGDTSNVVEVRTRLERGLLSIEVRDNGIGLDAMHLEAVEQLVPDPSDVASLSEHGRGLAIIKQVMNEVSYRQRGGVNTLRMSLRTTTGSDRSLAG